MEQEFEPEADDSLISAITEDHRSRLTSDPIYRLQHEKEDQIKSFSLKERLTALQDLQSKNCKEDSKRNSELRKSHRLRRARDNELMAEGRKRQMSIPLVEPRPDDEMIARQVHFKRTNQESFRMSKKLKRVKLCSQSVENASVSNSYLPMKKDSDPSTSLTKLMRRSLSPSNLSIKTDQQSTPLPNIVVTLNDKKGSRENASSLELLSVYDE